MRTPNGKLFVENSIDIKASADKVWKVITDSELSEGWIQSWWPEVHLESEWKYGSDVLWKTETGHIGSRGQITFLDPMKVLRYTFNAHHSKKEEVLTFVLHDHGEFTHFTVSVGDFADSPEHETCYPGAVESWKRSLPRIKYLAESLK